MKKHLMKSLMLAVTAGALLTLYTPDAVYAAEMDGRSGAPEGVAPGEAYESRLPEYEEYEVIVTADVLNVRAAQGTTASIVMQVKQNETCTVVGEPVLGWYPVHTDYADGWVCGDYIERTHSETESAYQEIEGAYPEIESAYPEIERTHPEAEQEYNSRKKEETYPAVAVDSVLTGSQIVDFACQFIGNPYVWGGTSLTDGADCSGFVQSVYEHFGISLLRTTYEMVHSGQEVAYEDAMPGDLILYDGHVGIYMGDGKIVNAMNEEDGIGICSAEYTDIISVRRVL